MLATGVTNTIEKNLKATLYFTFGVDVTALKYNYYTAANNSVFSNNYLLLVPVTLKKYYFISKRSSLFMDFGIAASYYFYCKKEIENIGSSTQRNLGLSIGGLGRIGFKTAVTPKVSFDVGLNSFSDFLYFYKDDANKITVKTNSLMFSFCKELK